MNSDIWKKKKISKRAARYPMVLSLDMDMAFSIFWAVTAVERQEMGGERGCSAGLGLESNPVRVSMHGRAFSYME